MRTDPRPVTHARILICDDEHANVRLLERLLLTGGFTEVRSTMDPRQVLDLVESFEPDLVMLDLNMPEMDGISVLNAIRARQGPRDHLPVLVLTADTTRATKERALSNGATDFLTKPFERTEVLLRTRNLVESRYLHLALASENKGLEAKLLHQAFHDSLTGLANRARFRDRVEHALSRVARGANSALLFIDLDDFKSVNDGLGHSEGDLLLRVAAERLLAATRGCDTVARLSGDEFAVLLDNIGQESDAVIVVERVLESLRAPVTLAGREILMSASIGIAHARAENFVDELLRNADVAMYRAKAAGKGRYAIFEPGMYSDLVRRLELTDDLRHAVGRGELRVLYQPIVDLATGVVSGVEALLRWQRQSQDEKSPESFIPLAEETGLIVPIGRWVLAEACRQAQGWPERAGGAAPLSVSVNVSGRQLDDPGFADDVAGILADTGLAPSRLIIELTESMLLENHSAIERLKELRELGVRIAIDDFGTGYSNLGHLQRFPVDIVKIDRSFVTRISESGETGFAHMILALAKALKLHTVAEGIETEAQRQVLADMGCAAGQGYLFARPTGSAEIAAHVASMGMEQRISA
jgi:diguanylate cyclase (GGDEF)-like protein